MGTFKTIDEAREFFKGDVFATYNGCRIDELSDELCVCSMTIDKERHCNAYGGIMGGVMFTLGDFAFAVASNNRHQLTVALDVTINYLSAPKGDRLIAKATCLKDGRTTGVYNVDIYDDTDRHIARFFATGFKK